MMRAMGDTISRFLENVNHLHHCLYHRFPEAHFPRFNVKLCDNPEAFIFSYWSTRGAVLWALVEGVLSRAAERLYYEHLEMTRLEQPEEGYLVSWTIKTSRIPPNKRAPEPVVSNQANKAGSLWHSILISLACSGHKKKKKPQRTSVLTPGQKASLDKMQRMVSESRDDPAALLMHSVRAENVAAEWD